MKTETLRHKEAFEYYYILGEKRHLAKVAEKYSVSRAAVYKWSIAFNWQERIQQRDIEIGKELEKKTNISIINEKANYRRLIKVLISQFVGELKEKKIYVTDIMDLERLVKLDLLLMGEPELQDVVLKVIYEKPEEKK